MIFNRKISAFGSFLISAILIFAVYQPGASQELKDRNKIAGSWLILQLVPNLSWTNLPSNTHFAFEWEAAPVLYSFGMNKLDPKWHFFSATQPERFAGSVEFIISTQLYTTRIGTSHWGFSGQLLVHIPLIERGEHLGLNIGAARYNIAGISSNYIVGGFSTIFGFLHYNIKYSPVNKILMHSIEFRFF